MTAEDCREIVSVCKSNHIVLAVCHVLRYMPWACKIKEIIESGEIGEVVNIQHTEPVSARKPSDLLLPHCVVMPASPRTLCLYITSSLQKVSSALSFGSCWKAFVLHCLHLLQTSLGLHHLLLRAGTWNGRQGQVGLCLTMTLCGGGFS